MFIKKYKMDFLKKIRNKKEEIFYRKENKRSTVKNE